MRRRSWGARLLLGTLAAGGLLATHVPVSKADCLWGVVYVTRKNAAPIPVYGPGCIVEQDWTWITRTWDQKTANLAPIPDGTPNGYYYEFIIAGP